MVAVSAGRDSVVARRDAARMTGKECTVPTDVQADPQNQVRNGGGTTRLAPSPTGVLHLGNARTFLVNWAMARRHGWRIVLRIEDLDGPRVKEGAIEQTVDLLRWLGMDWDEGPVVQSLDLSPYIDAASRLAGVGAIYPCELTRAQIEAAASAPQEGAHEIPFPRSMRPTILARTFEDTGSNWRFATPDETVCFVDGFCGEQSHRPCDTVGDFVVWTKRGQPSYQLAVVVDDARQGVTQVVRGNDLLDSAARQILLYRALGAGPPPAYTHLPLVVGADGRRLAKRHGDTRLDAYRAAGVRAERVIGWVAATCAVGGSAGAAKEISAAEFRDALDLNSIPRTNVVFTAEADSWLKS